MNKYTDLILKYRLGEMTITEREEFNRNLCHNLQLRKEFLFQEKLDKIMKKSLMLEAIENDPDLIKAEILACQDIENYMEAGRSSKKQTESNNINVETEVQLRKKIAKAEVEMVLSGIDNVSEVWVRNFDMNKAAIRHDASAQRIVEYVKKSDPFDQKAITMYPKRKGISRNIMLQAAAAVLVLSLLLFKSLTPSYTGDSIYQHYYSPLEANSLTLRGNAQSANGQLQEGIDYYISKDYGKAEEAFNNLRKMKQNLPEVLLFSGLNQMEQNNIPAAIGYFNDILSAEDQFIPEAQWYLGLCYIKTGETLRAVALMEILAETEGLYKKKAQLILKNLKR